MFQVCAPVFEEPELPSSPIAVDRTDENSSYRIGERRVGQRANAGTERQPSSRLRRPRRNEDGGSRRRVVAFLASLGRRTARIFARAYERVGNKCSMNTSLGPREVNVWRRREGGTVVGRTVSRRVWREGGRGRGGRHGSDEVGGGGGGGGGGVGSDVGSLCRGGRGGEGYRIGSVNA